MLARTRFAATRTPRTCSRASTPRSRSPRSSRSPRALWRSFPQPESDLREAAKTIRCPTLVCWGWLDPVVPVLGAFAAARTIPDAQLALFRTGHTPFVEATTGFLRKVEPFVSRLLASARSPESYPPAKPRASWRHNVFASRRRSVDNDPVRPWIAGLCLVVAAAAAATDSARPTTMHVSDGVPEPRLGRRWCARRWCRPRADSLPDGQRPIDWKHPGPRSPRTTRPVRCARPRRPAISVARIAFNGNQRFVLPSMTLVGLQPYSVAVWVRAAMTNTNMTTVSKVYDTTSNRNVFNLIVRRTDNRVVFEGTNQAGTSTYLETPGAIALDNVWRHLATTWNGSTKRLYIDGVLSDVETTTAWTRRSRSKLAPIAMPVPSPASTSVRSTSSCSMTASSTPARSPRSQPNRHRVRSGRRSVPLDR